MIYVLTIIISNLYYSAIYAKIQIFLSDNELLNVKQENSLISFIDCKYVQSYLSFDSTL